MDTKEIMRLYDESPGIVNGVGYGKMVEDFESMIDKSTRAKIRARSEAIQKENKRQNLIRENTCPICSGKLTRGKRNKNNDYKREWACSTCSSVHYI